MSGERPELARGGARAGVLLEGPGSQEPGVRLCKGTGGLDRRCSAVAGLQCSGCEM